MKAKGFTLIEMVIVVVIMSIILGMTIYMGYGFLQSVQYRQDRDLLIGALDDLVTMARTSSYYKGEYFTSLDIYLSGNGYTGTITSGISAPFGDGLFIDHYDLSSSNLLLPSGPLGVRLTPYALSCSVEQGATGFELESTVSDHTTCFELVPEVCKFKQVQC